MDTFLVGILLILAGLCSALAGYGLFRIVLPLLGFVAGFSVGFALIQGLFGANVWSLFAALSTALITGVFAAVLAYFYYTIGVMVIVGSLLAGVFAYLGQAIGLREEGFVVFMLALTGAVIGGILVLRYGLQHSFVVYFTAMFGVGLVLMGTFLLVGDLSLTDLHEEGIVQAIRNTVTMSWVWLITWIGASVLAASLQMAIIAQAVFGDQFVIEETKK